MDNLSNYQPLSEQKPAIRVGIAVLVGQIVVNLPVLMIILVVTFVGITRTLILMKTLPALSELVIFLGVMGSMLIGALAGWLWWAFTIPRWRRWALKNGIPEAELQKWAVLTSLVWPKSATFGKTEHKDE